MGLLDLPAPLLASLDGALGELAPAPLRLALWGLFAAVVSMGLYLALSPQRQIAEAKAAAVAARRALDAHDGDFAAAWPLIGGLLRSAFRQLALVTGPAVLASLPVLAVLAWASTTYGHAFPAATSEVAIRTAPAGLEARVETAPLAAPSAAPHHEIVVTDASGHVIERVLWRAPVPTIHKRRWWNALLGNPAGYLPEGGPLELIELQIPVREYLPLGPSWLKAWYVPFFGVLLLSSLAIKVAARIE